MCAIFGRDCLMCDMLLTVTVLCVPYSAVTVLCVPYWDLGECGGDDRLVDVRVDPADRVSYKTVSAI